MDADAIRELFEPVGRVQLRRMFGGQGVYLDGLIIAIEAYGDLYLKTDDTNRGLFEIRESRPFTYSKLGKDVVMTTFWALPATAFDNEDELRELTLSSLAASRRTQAKKEKRQLRRRITAASD